MATVDPGPRGTWKATSRRLWRWTRTLVARNFLLKVLSLAIALLLWGMVREEQDVDESAQVTVRVERRDDQIILDHVPSLVTVRLVGPRSRLRLAQQQRLEIVLDLKDATAGQHSFNVTNLKIQNLPTGVRIAGIQPSTLSLRLDSRAEKEVRIRADVAGDPATDYLIGEVTVTPDRITLEGAASELEGMEQILTQPVDVTGVSRSIQRQVGLEFGQLYVWPQAKIEGVLVEIAVDQVRVERAFEAVPVRAAEELGAVEIDPPVARVTVEGPRSLVEALTPEDVSLQLVAGEGEPTAWPAVVPFHKSGEGTGPWVQGLIGGRKEVGVKAVDPERFTVSAPERGASDRERR